MSYVPVPLDGLTWWAHDVYLVKAVARMGEFYKLIQDHIDAQSYEVSERQIAKRLGVSQTTLSNWRTPKKLIEKKHIVAVSRLTGVRYRRVLDALIDDIDYGDEGSTMDRHSTGDT